VNPDQIASSSSHLLQSDSASTNICQSKQFSRQCVLPNPPAENDANRLLMRQVMRLQWITLSWMAVECAVALIAAIKAHSLSLLVFGADSLIEFLSALVVLLHFSPRFPLDKRRAEQGAAILLFALAIVVTGMAILAQKSDIESSPLGIAITVVALAAMPILAGMKRHLAQKLGNSALAADATQSATCAYLAAVTLASLSIYALFHVRWADTVAALAAVPVLIIEGRKTWKGEGCGCCR
jgi:divalent metal cation (Fe/Co/Zn/Cd) transporter